MKGRFNSPPSYIVIYSFNGTMQRGGIGHIALWDGASYYSYGEGNGSPWIEACTDALRADERAVLDHRMYGYGPLKKIILPSNWHLFNHYESIRSEIDKAWKTNEYSVANKNCAHMVQDYLVKAKYTSSIPDFMLFPLYPSEVADNAKNISKAMVLKIADEVMHKPDTRFQSELYESFLKLLNEVTADTFALNESQKKALYDAIEEGTSDKEKFCRVLAVIAQHHYDCTKPQYKINWCDQFYENMFIMALNICFRHPKFENEPQILKTGCLRYPIAAGRILTGTLLSPVIAIGYIPAGSYKLYGWMTKKKEEAQPLLSASHEVKNAGPV